MRSVLEKNAKKWVPKLTNGLRAQFPRVGFDPDDFIGAAFERALLRIDDLEADYLALPNRDELPREAFLFGWLRHHVKWQAVGYINSPRRKRTINPDDSTLRFKKDAWEEDVYSRPIGVTLPEQEEVVFKKQLLEFCSALPPDERMVMRLTFDRATTGEILQETGMSIGELLARRMSAMKSLVRSAEGGAK
jgi:DNA-directed RNA polymerase specialized sigma24 family protein